MQEPPSIIKFRARLCTVLKLFLSIKPFLLEITLKMVQTGVGSMRIAITNQKGGVGKTSVSVHVSGALAERGHDVLVIDTDPQGHLSEIMGLEDQYDSGSPNLYEALVESAAIDDCIHEHPEVDVVPSHVRMFQAESDLLNTRRREEQLRVALDDLAREYDYVVIDTPPTLGVVTDNVLVASEHLIIPAAARTSSIRAVELLWDEIEALDEAFDMDHEVVAVVLNEVLDDGETEEMREWFGAAFEGTPIHEIRKRVALQRAENVHRSIHAHDEDCDMAKRYHDLAGDIEEVSVDE